MGTTSGNNYTTLYSTTAGQVQPGRTTGSNLAVQDQGSTITSTANTLNFTGNGVVASAVGNVVTIDIPGSSGTALVVQDEGNTVTSTANTLNFTGSVTATAVGNVVTVNVTAPTVTSNIIFNGNSNVSIPAADGNVYINANAGTDFQTVFDTSGNITVPGQILGSKFANASSPLGANIALTANTITTKVKSGTVFTESTASLDSWTAFVNGDQPGANASFSFIELRTFDENAPTANISVQSAATGVTKLWSFDSTGTLTTPANSVISSVSNDLTLQANTLNNNLRIAGVADNGGLPSARQSGWYINSNWFAGTNPAGPWSNAGLAATATDLDVYSFFNGTGVGSTLGSADIIIDPTSFESLQLGPLTWDSANAAVLVGKSMAMFDFDVSNKLPLATIFPVNTTVVSVNVGTNTITLSNTALKTSTNFFIDFGVIASTTTPSAGFYQLIGSTGSGSIDYVDPPTGLTTAYGLTGYGGPLLANPPAGNAFTYTPSLTWTTYPQLRTYSSPGGYRAIDQNNVPETVMSFTRYNNPILIGADATGNAAGWPTITGRADNQRYYQGLSLINTGLDTRPTGEIVAGSPLGVVPTMAINFVNYETPNANANVIVQRQTREKQGPLVSSLTGAGNINTLDSTIYARQYQGLGRLAWNGLSGTTGVNNSVGLPNPVAPMAGIYSRAETDFNVSTSTPTGLYLQYTPTGLGFGAPRTFGRAESSSTTINGATAVYLKPVANKAPVTVQSTVTSSTSVRNFLRELNAVQNQSWLTASYYTGNSNVQLQGTGSNVAVRSDARIGNVALNIGRNSISSMSAAWASAQFTTQGQYISSGGNYYEATGTNNTGASYFKLGTVAPSHTSGNVINGNTYLTYIGSTAAEGAASYELVIRNAETALTLYDVNNTKNIATFTNTVTTLNTPLKITGSSSGSFQVSAAATGATQTYTLPDAYPTVNGQVLVSTTAGTMSWAASGSTGATYLDANWTTATGTVSANVIYALPLSSVSSSGITIATGNTAIDNSSSTGPTRITLGTGGNFNLQFSVQLINTDNNEQDFDIWLRKNGSDVANSNTQVTVLKKNVNDGKSLVALNLLLTGNNAGDFYELVWATSNAGCKPEVVAAISSPYVRPVTPSIIATVTPVGA